MIYLASSTKLLAKRTPFNAMKQSLPQTLAHPVVKCGWPALIVYLNGSKAADFKWAIN